MTPSFVVLTFLSPLLASPLVAASTIPSNALQSTTISRSTRAKASCVAASVPITIMSTNLNFDIPSPRSQFEVTGILQEFFEVNSTFLQDQTNGTKNIVGTYNIATRLCFPPDAVGKASTVQVLTNGLGLDKTYWDVDVPGYSYIDAATEAGYATLSYDRLGVGESDHPDPINVVQSFAHVEILHGLVEALHRGKIGNKTFENIVGVAHSYGSLLQLGHDVKYPHDFDAVILTGIGETFDYLPLALYALDPTIASTVNGEFANLLKGYLAVPSAVALQEPLFRYPYINDKAFAFILFHVGSFAISDYLTASAVVAPATAYAGPVDVVLPQYDFVFCQGDCTELDGNQAAGFISKFYPNASANRSASYIVPDCGHNINGHYAAPKAFKQMLGFLDGLESGSTKGRGVMMQ